jgi:hypothetical protein
MGALLEITRVTLSDPLPEDLQGGFLDAPRVGTVLDAERVDVLGWALGAERPAVAVEFARGEKAFWRAPVRLDRPDLAEAFPGRSGAGRDGFAATLDLVGKEPELEVGVSIVLDDGRRAPLARIDGRRRWRRERSLTFARLVSIVIVCPDPANGRGPGAAVESALAQTYPHLEIILVGAGAGAAAAAAPGNPAVKRVGEWDLDPVQARNIGIRSSNGDLLVFLDAGAEGELRPTAVEAGVRALEEHPACAAAKDSTAVPAWAVYRRSLFEHLRGFDPALGADAVVAFDQAVAHRFAVCELDGDRLLQAGD